jgi:hypothetical protein
LISTPMIAKIVQTAKQMVKAVVLSPRARAWSDKLVALTGIPLSVDDSRRRPRRDQGASLADSVRFDLREWV